MELQGMDGSTAEGELVAPLPSRQTRLAALLVLAFAMPLVWGLVGLAEVRGEVRRAQAYCLEIEDPAWAACGADAERARLREVTGFLAGR